MPYKNGEEKIELKKIKLSCFLFQLSSRECLIKIFFVEKSLWYFQFFLNLPILQFIGVKLHHEEYLMVWNSENEVTFI